ncbi:hypothetical protein, partial [uncultured Nevskia sp.]|uniref:hypothetical protein n=1 Tax=uncultured Nevskia sp. TaxID=228950 RepID=UPI0025CF1953
LPGALLVAGELGIRREEPELIAADRARPSRVDGRRPVHLWLKGSPVATLFVFGRSPSLSDFA